MKAFIEPYYSGSHKVFADAVLKKFSGDMMLFSLPGRHWKWRMHGAAVTLADKVIDSGISFTHIMATSLIDLALFKSITAPTMPECRYTIYFHENQLCYPWSQNDRDPTERKDLHYGFTNFTSALVADRVIFNSKYNMNSFFNALGPFLKSFPDGNIDAKIYEIADKSEVIYPGFKPVGIKNKVKNDVPVILWNHRWEYDKNPEEFFNALFELKNRGVKFRLAVAGEERKRAPKVFEKAKEILKNEIVSWGYLENRKQYEDLLRRCDLLPVTSYHEFFGISVLEAVSAGVIPLLPERLSYPELFPPCDFQEFYYKEGMLADAILNSIEKTNNYSCLSVVKKAHEFASDHLSELFCRFF